MPASSRSQGRALGGGQAGESSWARSRGREQSPPQQYARQRTDVRETAGPKDQLAYSRQRRPVDYTPYSLRDYVAQYGAGAEYAELGKLGPDYDPDELAEKRQRQERVRAYAESVRHENRQLAAHAPEPRPKARAPSKRERAIEFAKRVPKPRARRETAPGSDGEGAEEEGEEEEMTLLQQLALRHKRDRELVDAIRRDLRL